MSTRPTQKSEKEKLNFLIFSQGWGIFCGLEMAGMKCILGVECDKNAIKTFDHNHKNATTFCGDIKDLTKPVLKELIGSQKVHAVVGGPHAKVFLRQVLAIHLIKETLSSYNSLRLLNIHSLTLL